MIRAALIALTLAFTGCSAAPRPAITVTYNNSDFSVAMTIDGGASLPMMHSTPEHFTR